MDVEPTSRRRRGLRRPGLVLLALALALLSGRETWSQSDGNATHTPVTTPDGDLPTPGDGYGNTNGDESSTSSNTEPDIGADSPGSGRDTSKTKPPAAP
jgi:hypothetical protein